METQEVIRFIKGQMKKHGVDFSISMKYLTDNNKVKKRHGEFVEFLADSELILYNREKDSRNVYQVERIVDIRKK